MIVVSLVLSAALLVLTGGQQQSNDDGPNQQFGGNRCIDDEGHPQVHYKRNLTSLKEREKKDGDAKLLL